MLHRLKISLILAPLALTMLVGVYIYTLWAKERERSADIPFDATGAMNRDLLKFHKKRGAFPEKLENLEGTVWEKKHRNYLSGGRALIHRNYFYIYSRVHHHRFTLWAIPVGKEREEGSTLFFVGNTDSYRSWKGPAVTLTDIETLSSTPTTINLNLLGLVEQHNFPAKTIER